MMPSSPKFIVFKRKLKKSLIFRLGVPLLIILALYIFYYFSKCFGHDHLKDRNFLEINKCPACYGSRICDKLLKGHVEFTSISRYRLLDYFNEKNIFFAKIDNKSDVMLKKLGHTHELRHMEQQICTQANEPNDCDYQTAIYKTKFAKAREFTSYTVSNISDMMRCPSQRLVSRMIEKYKERLNPQDFPLLERLHLYTTLLVNPEPILMQTFPAEEGWPFPKYFGACGRFIMESYEGKMLSSFHGDPWEERVDYAYQLLLAAEQLTDNEIGFSLYWTDVAYDNFVVNREGKVTYIDLENIIVVDKARIRREKKFGWDVPHYSEFHTCSHGMGICLQFSEEDLCSKYSSDHNYYAVCRNILSKYASDWLVPDGFLHDLPDHIEQKYHIAEMVEECVKPTTPDGRIRVVPKLISALRQIRTDYL